MSPQLYEPHCIVSTDHKAAGLIRFEKSRKACKHTSPLLLSQKSLASHRIFRLPSIFQLLQNS